MNKKRYQPRTIDDPEVQSILQDVKKYGDRKYLKIVNGRCVPFAARTALKQLPMTGADASKLLATYPFQTAEFVLTRTAKQLERRAVRVAAKAIAAEVKALNAIKSQAQDHAAEATRAIAEVADKDCDTDITEQPTKQGSDAIAERKALEQERQFVRRFQIESRSSGFWGIFDADLDSTRITGRTKQSALDEIAAMRSNGGWSSRALNRASRDSKYLMQLEMAQGQTCSLGHSCSSKRVSG